MAEKRDYYEVLGVAGMPRRKRSRRLTVKKPLNITRIKIPVMQRPKRSLRRPRRHTMYSAMLINVPGMTNLDMRA